MKGFLLHLEVLQVDCQSCEPMATLLCPLVQFRKQKNKGNTGFRVFFSTFHQKECLIEQIKIGEVSRIALDKFGAYKYGR